MTTYRTDFRPESLAADVVEAREAEHDARAECVRLSGIFSALVLGATDSYADVAAIRRADEALSEATAVWLQARATERNAWFAAEAGHVWLQARATERDA